MQHAFATDESTHQPYTGLVIESSNWHTTIKAGAAVYRNVDVASPLDHKDLHVGDLVSVQWRRSGWPLVVRIRTRGAMKVRDPREDTTPPLPICNWEVHQIWTGGQKVSWEYPGDLNELTHFEIDARRPSELEGWGYGPYPVAIGRALYHFPLMHEPVHMRIRSFDLQNNPSEWVWVGLVGPDGTPPPTPQGFRIFSLSGGILARWFRYSKPGQGYYTVADLAGFRLYMAIDEDGTDAKLVLDLGITYSVEYTFSFGMTRYFNLVAVDQAGNESDYAVVKWLPGQSHLVAGQNYAPNSDWERDRDDNGRPDHWVMYCNASTGQMVYGPYGWGGGRGYRWERTAPGSATASFLVRWDPYHSPNRVAVQPGKEYTFSIMIRVTSSLIPEYQSTYPHSAWLDPDVLNISLTPILGHELYPGWNFRYPNRLPDSFKTVELLPMENNWYRLFTTQILDHDTLGGPGNDWASLEAKVVPVIVQLDGALSNYATTFDITEEDDDLWVVAAHYPPSGHVMIDDEIMSYTVYLMGTFSGVTRGVLGTTATAHDDDALVTPYTRLIGIQVAMLDTSGVLGTVIELDRVQVEQGGLTDWKPSLVPAAGGSVRGLLYDSSGLKSANDNFYLTEEGRIASDLAPHGDDRKLGTPTEPWKEAHITDLFVEHSIGQISGAEWSHVGDMYVDANGEVHRVLRIRNDSGGGASLQVDDGDIAVYGDIVLTGTVDGVDLAGHTVSPSSHHDVASAGGGIAVSGQQISLNAVTAAGDGLVGSGTIIHLSTPGTLDVDSANVATGAHTHMLDASSNPGGAARILATDADGGVTVEDAIVTEDLEVGGTAWMNRIRAKGELRDTHFVSKTLIGPGVLYMNPSGLQAISAVMPDGTPPYDPPSASFTIGDTDIEIDDIVQFIDTSTADAENNPIVAWEWDLNGNGLIDSFEEDPTFQYTAIYSDQYIYPVLTVIAEDGQSSTHVTGTPIYVNPDEPPPPPTNRVTDQLQVLYLANDGTGTTLADQGGVGAAENFTLQDSANVTWEPHAVVVNSPTIFKCDSFTKVKAACATSGAITLEGWLDPASSTASGLKRIFTMSGNKVLINFGIYQNENQWGFRLRHVGGDDNAAPTLYSGVGTLSPVMTHVVYTRDDSGNETIYLNGKPCASGSRAGALTNWGTYDATVVDDPTGDRAWLGRVGLLAAYSKALSQYEVTTNHIAGWEIDSTGSTAPTAFFIPDDTTPAKDQTVNFDNLSSEHASNPITGYQWDLDGDGVFDSAEFEPSKQYDTNFEGRRWDVILRVTATDGQTDDASVWMEMEDSNGPLPPDGDVTVINWAFPYGEEHVTTHWVNKSGGSDGYAGTSRLKAWKTIAFACKQARPGMVIGIMPGTYHEQLELRGASTGTKTQPLIFIALGKVIIDGNSSEGWLADLVGVHYVKLQGIRFEVSAGMFATAKKKGNWVRIGGGSTNCCLRELEVWMYGDIVEMYRIKGKNWSIKVVHAEYVQIDSCTCRGSAHGIGLGDSAKYVFINYCAFTEQWDKSVSISATENHNYNFLFYRCLMDYPYMQDGVMAVNPWDCPDKETKYKPGEWEPWCTEKDTDLTKWIRQIIFRQCIFRRCGEQGIDLKSTLDIFVDECIFYGILGSNTGWDRTKMDSFLCGTVTRGSRTTSSHVRVRKSIMYGNCPGTKTDGAYWAMIHNTYIANNRGVKQGFFGMDEGYNSSFRHNGLVGMYAHRQSGQRPGQHFVNNAVVNQNDCYIAYDHDYDGPARIDGNLYYDSQDPDGTKPDGCVFASMTQSNWKAIKTLAAWKTQLASQGITGAEAHSKFSKPPKFRNCPDRPDGDKVKHYDIDTRPRSTSPLVGAGVDLATTTNSGSNSTRLKVDDAFLFCDGFGIAVGDTIVVHGTTVRITKINYDTNTITLKDAISWASGKPVNLHHSTTNPNIGALGPNSDPWWLTIFTDY